jgi:glutamate 5-kinase
VRLRAAGHKVVLVSSGAIGVGLQRMAMPARPKSLSGKQASQNKEERDTFSVDLFM